MFLFLIIQIVGVTAMAISKARFPCTPVFQESSNTPRRLMTRIMMLKRQNVRKPVVKDINFYKFNTVDYWFTKTNIPFEYNINSPDVDQVAGLGGEVGRKLVLLMIYSDCH